MSVSELKTIAKSLGIKGSYSMKKAELITAIEGLKARPPPLEMSGSIEMEKPKDEQKDVKPKDVKSARKPNSWNDHIRAYRAEHSCSLREAMSKARETYGKCADSPEPASE
jgi:hypothetical protein